MAKSLFNLIADSYPELLDNPRIFIDGIIKLRNDSDDLGDYIEAWNYEKPLPSGLKIGK